MTIATAISAKGRIDNLEFKDNCAGPHKLDLWGNPPKGSEK